MKPTIRGTAAMQQVADWLEKRHSDLFKVLIREIGQDGKADVVLGKALGILPETEPQE
jgi:hypothetical protein